ADETQVRLVNQGGGVEAVAGRLGGQARSGELAQLVVDERQEIRRGLAIAPGGGFEQSGDGGHGPQDTRRGRPGCGKPAPPDASEEPVARSGLLDMRGQAEMPSALRTDTRMALA